MGTVLSYPVIYTYIPDSPIAERLLKVLIPSENGPEIYEESV